MESSPTTEIIKAQLKLVVPLLKRYANAMQLASPAWKRLFADLAKYRVRDDLTGKHRLIPHCGDLLPHTLWVGDYTAHCASATANWPTPEIAEYFVKYAEWRNGRNDVPECDTSALAKLPWLSAALTPADYDLLAIAGYLHDIGKAGNPPADGETRKNGYYVYRSDPDTSTVWYSGCGDHEAIGFDYLRGAKPYYTVFPRTRMDVNKLMTEADIEPKSHAFNVVAFLIGTHKLVPDVYRHVYERRFKPVADTKAGEVAWFDEQIRHFWLGSEDELATHRPQLIQMMIILHIADLTSVYFPSNVSNPGLNRSTRREFIPAGKWARTPGNPFVDLMVSDTEPASERVERMQYCCKCIMALWRKSYVWPGR